MGVGMKNGHNRRLLVMSPVAGSLKGSSLGPRFTAAQNRGVAFLTTRLLFLDLLPQPTSP
jgi:hypothetical protein